MKKRAFLLRNACIILLFLLTAQLSFSQNNFKVTGKITDDTGKPVDGATVQVKGTTTATVAKADGTFEVNAPSENSTLIISYVGFLEQEVPLKGQAEISLSLSPLVNSLEDVVVVGYGSRKRVEVTGATTCISGEELRSVQTTNLTQALQGRLAGVDATSSGFRPGTGSSIRIRGNRSLSANNDPLYVVDGFPVSYTIDDMNPADIESSYFDLIYEAKEHRTLFTLNVKTGELKKIFTERAWLNHIQFSSKDPNLLMFCHEGPWHKVDRIWTIDVSTGKAKMMHKRSMPMEIAGHEFRSVDGKKIWFDLQLPKGQTFYLVSVDVKTGEERKYAMKRDEWSIHFNISPDQKLFAGDGGDPGQVAKAKDGQWIYLFALAGDSLRSMKLVNMKHHNYKLEPNVHFSPDGKWVIFRANFEGHTDVYAVEINPSGPSKSPPKGETCKAQPLLFGNADYFKFLRKC